MITKHFASNKYNILYGNVKVLEYLMKTTNLHI